MSSKEIQTADASLQRAGYVVLDPRDVDALRRIPPTNDWHEIQFVFGRATTAFDPVVRRIG